MLGNIEKISVSEIVRATGGTLIFGENESVRSISTDSRETGENCLYIPLKGERFDGHSFFDGALKSGAIGYLTQNGEKLDGYKFGIKVADTKKALGDIAKYYRQKFDVSVVALTGSVGKTTTKEFVASVLSARFNTVKTQANYNNDIGLPFTVFSINSKTEIAVVEMGMSNFGEISYLTNLARPDNAIITNIGTSHIEFLKSREGILKAKCEIFEGLKNGGTAFLNGDDDLLQTLSGKLEFNTVFFGIDNKNCDLPAENIKLYPEHTEFEISGEKFKINLPGRHNVYNALCAYAVGKLYGMTDEEIRNGLLNYKSDGIRQSIIDINGAKILNDCYNSSPQAAKSAIDVLKTLSNGRKIAVLGDMAELGEMSEKYHREVGAHFAEEKCDILVTVGSMARFIADEAKKCGADEKNVHSFDNNTEVCAFLKSNLQKGDAVLIKGSHCMRMDEISKNL